MPGAGPAPGRGRGGFTAVSGGGGGGRGRVLLHGRLGGAAGVALRDEADAGLALAEQEREDLGGRGPGGAVPAVGGGEQRVAGANGERANFAVLLELDALLPRERDREAREVDHIG